MKLIKEEILEGMNMRKLPKKKSNERKCKDGQPFRIRSSISTKFTYFQNLQ